MAVMDATLPKARFARYDKSKGILGWLTTVDHKKIAIMYLFTTFFFFLVGGIMALLVRIQLAEPQNTFLTPEQYNQIFTMHGTTMIFLWIIPVWAGLGNYLRPADDRRARHGVPAHQRALVLAHPARRHGDVLRVPRPRDDACRHPVPRRPG